MKARKGKESYSSLEKTLRITRGETRAYVKQVARLREEVAELRAASEQARWANFVLGVLARALNEAQEKASR